MKHQLADARLGADGPLGSFVRSRRAAGLSWRRIERDLLDRTGVDVTGETLRTWFPDPVEAAS